MDVNSLDIAFKMTPGPGGELADMVIDTSSISRKWQDVPYADQSKAQMLDIYLPEQGEGPFPVLIFVHGGAYIFGNKRDSQFLHAIGGIKKGYAVVSVEYRLATEAQFPYPLFDVKAAIRFLRAHAEEYLLDPDRFALSGDSAGGFYTALAAATQDIPGYEDKTQGNPDYSSKVQCAVTWYGCFDFLSMIPEGEEEAPAEAAAPAFPDVRAMLLGAPPRQIKGLIYFTNALNFITDKLPPMLIQHGDGDMIVPVSQAYELYNKICDVCGPDRAELEIIKGWNHGGVCLDWYEQKNQTHVFEFLDKYLKK